MPRAKEPFSSPESCSGFEGSSYGSVGSMGDVVRGPVWSAKQSRHVQASSSVEKLTFQCVSGWPQIGLGDPSGDLVVGHGLVERSEAEQRLEGGHRGPASVVTEDVLVEVDR